MRYSWSDVDPFQFNEKLSLPDFDFNKKDIKLSSCDKTYESGTYSCIQGDKIVLTLNLKIFSATFHMRRLLGYYILSIYVPTVKDEILYH